MKKRKPKQEIPVQVEQPRRGGFVSTWLKNYNTAMDNLAVPRAFLLGVQLSNKFPHNLELENFLFSALKAISDAERCIAHEAELEKNAGGLLKP